MGFWITVLRELLSEGPAYWGTSRVLLVIRVTVLRPPVVGVARAPAVPSAGGQSASPSGILSAGGTGLLLRHNVPSGQATPVMEHCANGRSCLARRTSAPWGHAEVTLCSPAQAAGAAPAHLGVLPLSCPTPKSCRSDLPPSGVVNSLVSLRGPSPLPLTTTISSL